MDARLDLAGRLAVELRRHNLVKHLDHLRTYYRATRAGQRAPWSDQHVTHLAQVLQVLPGLEVRRAGSTCCEGFLARTVVHLAERYLVRCSGCNREWLVLLAPAAVAA